LPSSGFRKVVGLKDGMVTDVVGVFGTVGDNDSVDPVEIGGNVGTVSVSLLPTRTGGAVGIVSFPAPIIGTVGTVVSFTPPPTVGSVPPTPTVLIVVVSPIISEIAA
jgi:hypothetical protein